ncbi:hypothetical protein [Ralstonia sp. GP71]|uniref:hypothetical protein n=1 Tax=Ralstonia sp. GP71 TaxID=3035152 RepID=UPI003891D8FB
MRESLRGPQSRLQRDFADSEKLESARFLLGVVRPSRRGIAETAPSSNSPVGVACIKVVTLLDYLSLAAWNFIVVDRAKVPCIEVNVLSRRIIIRLCGDVKRFMQKAR